MRKIDINRKDNPKFFEILDEHNALMQDWNRLNNEFMCIKQPKFLLLGHKARLTSYYVSMESIQGRFIGWNEKAHAFLHKPHFIFSEEEESELGFMHFTGELRFLIHEMDSHMMMLADTFVKLQQRHGNQVNFLIAIASFVLTFVGLLVTIFTIFKAL
jgi:hypothetical protein